MQLKKCPLYVQAAKTLGSTQSSIQKNSLKSFPSRLTTYVSLCTLNINNPNTICTFANQIKDNHQSLKAFSKALYSVSLYFMNDAKCRLSVENTYKSLLQIDQVGKYLFKNRDIPTELLQCLKIEDGLKMPQPAVQILQQMTNSASDSSLQGSKAIARLLLLFTKMEQPHFFTDDECTWTQVLKIVGQSKISSTKLIQIIISSIVKAKKYKSALFLFQKLNNLIGIQVIADYLFSNETNVHNFARNQIKQNQSLSLLFDEYNSNEIIYDPNIVTLALLAKHSIIDQKQIFLKLTPALNEILIQGEERYKHYHNILVLNQPSKMKTSVQTLDCRKQQFLTQLVLINEVYVFKRIIDEFKLNVFLLNHPPLIFAFSQLLQWSIEPLFQLVNYSNFFSKNKKSNLKSKIPKGSLAQFDNVNLYFIEKIWELLSLSSGFILARRSTFIKFCRLLTAICKADKGIKILKQDELKLCSFISKCLIKYLIPALQFYKKDYSVIYQLNNILECFSFKYQQQLLLQTIVSRPNLPFPILGSMLQACQQQNTLLNRISETNQHIIQKQIKKLVEDRPLSALQELFNRLVVRGTSCICKNMVKIVVKSHPIVKKAIITFIFQYLLQNQSSLVNKDSTFSPQFTILIEFINLYLLSESNSLELTKLLIDYLKIKLQPCDKELVELGNFQFFSSYITFIYEILKHILPIQITENSRTQYENAMLRFINGGTCLNVFFQDEIDKFIRSKKTRVNFCRSLLDKPKPFQSKFYLILFGLFRQNSSIFQSKAYNINHICYLFDQINYLINYLVQLVHLEISSSEEIQLYFSFEMLDQLLNRFQLPLSVCFTLLRRGVFDKYHFCTNGFFSQNQWKNIKQIYDNAVQKQLLGTFDQPELALKNLQYNDQIYKMEKSDLFLIFWLLPYESSIRKRNSYYKAIKNVKKELKKVQSIKQQYNRIVFLQELTKQQQRVLQIPQIRKILASFPFKQSFAFVSNQKDQSLLRKFIHTCIISRALISKNDTHFAWSFLLNLLQHCRIQPKRFFRIICLLRQQICEFLIVQTQREATQILPLLANLPNYFTQSWHNRKIIQKRLTQYSILSGSLTKKQYQSIVLIIKASSLQIITSLIKQKIKQIFCIAKNILQFLCLAKFLPMEKQEVLTINSFLDSIAEKYKNCDDIQTKLKRAKKIIADRYTQITNINLQELQLPQPAEKDFELPSFDKAGQGQINDEEKTTNRSQKSKRSEQSTAFHSPEPSLKKTGAKLKKSSKNPKQLLRNIEEEKRQKIQEETTSIKKQEKRKQSKQKNRDWDPDTFLNAIVLSSDESRDSDKQQMATLI